MSKYVKKKVENLQKLGMDEALFEDSKKVIIKILGGNFGKVEGFELEHMLGK